jgi:protein-L-isoaspartate(D-aspartate) O-methyltransferase
MSATVDYDLSAGERVEAARLKEQQRKFAIARQKMVDGQVRTSDVTDSRIIDAMLEVPREAFVPIDAKQPLAYLDQDLDVLNGYLLRAALIAKLLQAAEIKATDKVLVAGAASGYMAAIAAKLAGAVVATETDRVRADLTTSALGRLGCTNVSVRLVAAAADGDEASAPFDVIVLNGATEVEPAQLCGQLAEGGRLVGVFAATNPSRAVIVTRSHGDFGHRTLFDAAAPTLPGLERRPEFVF